MITKIDSFNINESEYIRKQINIKLFEEFKSDIDFATDTIINVLSGIDIDKYKISKLDIR